jgi:hypothetical protein
MEKIWFININKKNEGPFSLAELKRDSRLTPDTLVWKAGFPKWVPIRKVPELQEIFQDECAPFQTPDDEQIPSADDIKPSSQTRSSRDEIVLDMRFEPPYIFLILLLIVLLMTYTLYEFYRLR